MTIDRRSVILVATGGAIGATIRWAVMSGADTTGRFPWPTLLVNLVGAFGLGTLVRRNRPTRFFLGAGVCGGLTTFSTFSLELAERLDADQAGLAASYLGTSIVLGLLAFWAGRRLS